MNLIRVVATTLVHFFITISTTSPNEHQEMGSMEGDKIFKDERKMLARSRMISSVILCIAVIYYIHEYSDIPYEYYDYISFALTFLGWALRMWSYWTLGYLFTFTVGMRKDHYLIENGPYAYLVHPSYTGQVMVYTFGLIFLKVPVLMVVAIGIYMLSRVIKRIKLEEKLLKREFGEKYQKILNTRYRLIPFVY
jgi:protein-S-isoprenylcysteine O-methyltransferase Ste14